MVAEPRSAGCEDESPRPALLILTGASHTGKTSVGRAIMELAGPPAASLSMDEIVEYTLSKPGDDRWGEIPLGYRLLEPQAEILIGSGWLVALESTFTYVPESGPSQFHRSNLERLVAIASRREVPHLLVQLWVEEAVALERAARTGRLTPEIVAETVRVHAGVDLPDSTLRLPGAGETPRDLAEGILGELTKLG
jgi:predicted kinase